MKPAFRKDSELQTGDTQPLSQAHSLFLAHWLNLSWRYYLQVSPIPLPQAPHAHRLAPAGIEKTHTSLS